MQKSPHPQNPTTRGLSSRVTCHLGYHFIQTVRETHRRPNNQESGGIIGEERSGPLLVCGTALQAWCSEAVDSGVRVTRGDTRMGRSAGCPARLAAVL